MSAPAPTVRLHPVAAWAALVFASLGVFLGGAELMVVAIALPAIVADFLPLTPRTIGTGSSGRS